MASSTGTKCPVCGKSVAVGLVSQTLLQHEDKNSYRCAGSGQPPRMSAARGTRTPTRVPGSSRPAPKTGAASKGGVTVRRVEVDPEVLKERQERTERLREERAEAARSRNEFGVSYFDEPGR
jgi:hypothetical protein